MKKIKLLVLLLSVIAVIAGCKKYNITTPYPATAPATLTKTKAEILTEKPWRLLSYGFDSNKNGLIDNSEESIRDCEKDNSYTFNMDGSGVFAENEKICDSNTPVNQFSWTLTNGDTVLDFYYGKADVLNLNTDTLYIANSITDDVKLLLLYGH